MKLLFDENLAAGLVEDLARLYPGSAHITELASRVYRLTLVDI